MISNPRSISLCRAESVNRLMRGRYFSTSFVPDVLALETPDRVRSVLLDFTKINWQPGR